MEEKKKIYDSDLLYMMIERIDHDIFAWGQCAHYAIREGYLVENDGFTIDLNAIEEKNNCPEPDGMWMSEI